MKFDFIFIILIGCVKIFCGICVFELFDLLIGVGEMFVLFGLLGCGKMIMLCLIVGFDIFDVGGIIVFGDDDVILFLIECW